MSSRKLLTKDIHPLKQSRIDIAKGTASFESLSAISVHNGGDSSLPCTKIDDDDESTVEMEKVIVATVPAVLLK